jgi:squalene monooxygenase
MRHPLTGGGMTIAFHDVVLLRDALTPIILSRSAKTTSNPNSNRQPVANGVIANGIHANGIPANGTPGALGVLREWTRIRKALKTWFWHRKPLASTINILSVALYDLFGADGDYHLLLHLVLPSKADIIDVV